MVQIAPATIAALYRHPVKGFTPEPLERATLNAGRAFPGDRLRAVEVGPSGFDPAAPTHISKMRFAVLARLPEIARVVTRWDEATDTLHVSAPGAPDLTVRLGEVEDDRRLEAWLSEFRGEEATARLRLLDGAGHRFMIYRLATDSREVWTGREIVLGEARLKVVKPIVRCVATHVDPVTGTRDIDVLSALDEHYGHRWCGLYLSVETGGGLAVGDRAELME